MRDELISILIPLENEQNPFANNPQLKLKKIAIALYTIRLKTLTSIYQSKHKANNTIKHSSIYLYISSSLFLILLIPIPLDSEHSGYNPHRQVRTGHEYPVEALEHWRLGVDKPAAAITRLLAAVARAVGVEGKAVDCGVVAIIWYFGLTG